MNVKELGEYWYPSANKFFTTFYVDGKSDGVKYNFLKQRNFEHSNKPVTWAMREENNIEIVRRWYIFCRVGGY